MPNTQLIKKIDQKEDSNKTQFQDSNPTPVEKTKQETFAVLDNPWFDQIISKIGKHTDFFNIYEDLWKTQSKVFFNYLINSENIDLEIKKDFLLSLLYLVNILPNIPSIKNGIITPL